MPPKHDVKVNIENFPQLDAAAKQRVNDALHTALNQELTKAGAAAEGVFGDGSVKGKTLGNAGGNVSRPGG